MGSSMSCIPKPCHGKRRMAKVFDTKGQLQYVELPMKAAEIMLEEPGTIVCCVDEIRQSRRFWALRADEELHGGKFYLVVCAKRVYTKLSDSELGAIDKACRMKAMTIGPKVFPSDENEKEEEEVKDAGFPGQNSGKCKQWRPILEPIHEGF